MYHEVNLILSATDTLEIDASYMPRVESIETSSGWWILPATIGGVLSWIGIFSLIF